MPPNRQKHDSRQMSDSTKFLPDPDIPDIGVGMRLIIMLVSGSGTTLLSFMEPRTSFYSKSIL